MRAIKYKRLLSVSSVCGLLLFFGCRPEESTDYHWFRVHNNSNDTIICANFNSLWKDICDKESLMVEYHLLLPGDKSSFPFDDTKIMEFIFFKTEVARNHTIFEIVNDSLYSKRVTGMGVELAKNVITFP